MNASQKKGSDKSKNKFASEPLEEVEYGEDSDGLMIPVRFKSAVKTLPLADGDLAYMEVHPPSERCYIIVFGWKLYDELLKSSFVMTHVRVVEDDLRELLERSVERKLHRQVFAW